MSQQPYENPQARTVEQFFAAASIGLTHQSVSENTQAMYASTQCSFQQWTQALGALDLPASPPTVASYLSHLAEECRLSVATIRLYKVALAVVHKAGVHEGPHR